MRKNFIFIIFLVFVSACSTQKNTWRTRRFQELTTRYNVHFNGYESFKKGIKEKENSYKENYSTLLPVYPISKNNTTGKSDFDYCIKKCEKAIELHSIRVKPKRKVRRNSSEKEQNFYKQEEFNPFMSEVFLLMARAQFEKGDYEAAASTCAYIERHFKQKIATCSKAAILRSRALINSDFIFDAENILVKLNNQKLPKNLTSEFSAAYAKLLLAHGLEYQSIPYLKLAIENTHNSYNRKRWYYLLAQLYHKQGKKDLAYKTYKKVINSNPDYLMEINARIRQTEVETETNSNKASKKASRKLSHLLRNKKNKNYKDIIEYAIGNIYNAKKDTANAILHYIQGIYQNRSNSLNDKNSLLLLDLALVDLYYNNFLFTKATPYIQEAASIINKEQKRYKEIQDKKEILNKLYSPLREIEVQDSLLSLSLLPRAEIDRIIEQAVETEEKKEKERENVETLQKNKDMMEETMPKKAKVSNQPIFNTYNKDWYFFNPELVKRGLNSFYNNWGHIKSEDFWRLKNKPKIYEKVDGNKDEDIKNNNDSIKSSINNPLELKEDSLTLSKTETKTNEYLINIPFSKKQKEEAKNKINESLLESGIIFRNLMQNDSLAINQFTQIEKNDKESIQLPESYFNLFLIYKQKDIQKEAYNIRKKLLSNFSDSKYAIKLQDSLYVEHLKDMYNNQDSIYEKSFDYFQANKTAKLFNNIAFVKKQYKDSELMPHFIFLESMQFAKIGEPQYFHDSLVYINETYPQSSLTPLIKDMLALWDEGKIPIPQGKYKSAFNINAFKEKRENETDSLKAKIAFNDKTEFRLLMCYTDSINKYNLQFDVALYNFTSYLIKDFELNFGEIGKTKYLQVSGFENKSDIDRYVSHINFKNEKPSKKYPDLKLIIISKENLELLGNGLALKDYLELYNKNYDKR